MLIIAKILISAQIQALRSTQISISAQIFLENAKSAQIDLSKKNTVLTIMSAASVLQGLQDSQRTYITRVWFLTTSQMETLKLG